MSIFYRSQDFSYKKYPNVRYHDYNIADDEKSNLAQYFDETGRIIDEALNRGEVVYVHCWAGISRSTSIIIAYLIKYFGWAPDFALKWVKQRRKIVRPNPGFSRQLIDYHAAQVARR
jgi:dual specificity phosphatase 12